MSTRDQLIEIALRAAINCLAEEERGDLRAIDGARTLSAAVIDALDLEPVGWRGKNAPPVDMAKALPKPVADAVPVFRVRGLESATSTDTSTSV